MKKRIIAAILAAAMALALTACGGTAGKTEQKPIAPLTEADLSFIFVETGNTAIAIGMTGAQIEENFGVTMEGLQNWTGDDIDIFCLPSLSEEGESTLVHAGINGVSDKLMTPRGIVVGDTMDDVIAAYGEPSETDVTYNRARRTSSERMIYKREGIEARLTFEVSREGVVEAIYILTY